MNFNDSMFRLPFFVVNDDRPALPLTQGIDWGAAMLRIPKVHELGFKGKGIRIAVIDTSAQLDHPDLQGAITQHFNTTAEPYNSIAGHSTGVCGIIGARDNQIGVVSMAPECEIIPIKALFEHGGGDLQDVVGAIELAIQLKVDIINMSLGTTSNVPALHSVIKRAASAGIIIICAAGNTGREGIHYPARYDECISVGAINQYRIVSSFSTRGLSLEVAAPGEVVLTTWKNSSWAKVSGTSFSSPAVAGIAALALQAGIPFNAQLLKETSIDIEEPGRDIRSGYGLINPVAIIERRQRPNPASSSSAPEPCPDLADAQQARAILAKAIQNLQNITNRTVSDVNNIQVELKESERLLQQY